MGNRPQNPNYQPENNDNDDQYPPRNSYPPQGNYPPQQGNIDLDDPRFGGGAPAPNSSQQQYPPPQPPPQGQSSYPPPQQPPQQGGSYPPPGGASSQGGNLNLDDPRFGGSGSAGASNRPAPQYPPPQQEQNAPQRQPEYAGPQNRPANQGPAGSSGNFGGPISLDDPRFGGNSGSSAGGSFGGQSGGSAGGRERITLDDPPYSGRPSRDDDPPRRPKANERRGSQRSLGLTENQVESLANGSVVILLGISLIQAVTGSSEFLRLIFPMAAGGILLMSAIYQRFMRKWHVSIWTWFIALLLVSYTITLFAAGDDAGPFRWITYFFGILIIMAGIIRTLQVFRTSDNPS